MSKQTRSPITTKSSSWKTIAKIIGMSAFAVVWSSIMKKMESLTIAARYSTKLAIPKFPLFPQRNTNTATLLQSQASQQGRDTAPVPGYASMYAKKNTLYIAEIYGNSIITSKKAMVHKDAATEMLTWLQQASQERQRQFVAAVIHDQRQHQDLLSRLWLQEDIVPYRVKHQQSVRRLGLKKLVKEVAASFDENHIAHIPLHNGHEVQVAELVTLEDYRKITVPADFTLLVELAHAFKGKRLIFINATPQGGGVALMRHALIRLLRLIGIDAHWYVLKPRKEVFNITKLKFHNVLQGVAGKNVELTQEDKALYNDWIQENAAALHDAFKLADVVVIDDPQPSGLIPYVKQANADAKIVYRSHIQLAGILASQPGTPQYSTWRFLWDKIQHADYFVSHPVKEFVPDNVPEAKILYMPATTDPLDGLNKPLTDRQMDTYLKQFNTILQQEGQTPLEEKRPYIVQIARFDPSKGIPDVLEAYRITCQMLEAQQRPLPQLVIAGNGSIDDPDGIPVYTSTKTLIASERYARYAHDIKVARLPHKDQILNTLLRRCMVALQLSIKEGFEVKVTEALMKGKPVIAYRTGGIPLQIEHEVTGYLVEAGDTTQVARHLYTLLTDQAIYKQMSTAAIELANKDFLTVSNAICWLYLAGLLVRGQHIEGNHQWVKALAEQSSSHHQK